MSIHLVHMSTYPIHNEFTYNSLQAELIDPALKGTLNVLRSCAKVPTVKRVVITSSMAAVAFNGKSLAPDVIIDETWFSDPAVCEKSKVHIYIYVCVCVKISYYILSPFQVL
jgi:nucleoside-diphosphate-sugar epimerase